MKFSRFFMAWLLAGVMAFAHAAPDTMPDGETDPIARFASPGEEAAGDLLLQAMSLIGVAYRFGGSSPESGLDCSGFIQYVFKKSLHVTLPRTAAGMAQVGREIERDELKAGDLVFFNTRGFRYSHVGIYLGNNKFIHSPRTGKNIQVANMTQSYWVSRYNGARRVSRGAQMVAEADSKPLAPVGKAARKPADEPASTVRAGKSSARKKGADSRQETTAKSRKKRSKQDDSASKSSRSSSKKKPVKKRKD